MAPRFIVIQPAPATVAAEVADDLAAALGARGAVDRVAAMEGIGIDDLARDPGAALGRLAERIGQAGAPAVVIDQVEDLPLSMFDVPGWNLDVAAATGAAVLLALDAEGLPPELVSGDILAAGARAAAHGTRITAVLVRGAAPDRIDAGDVPVLALPVSPEDLLRLVD